MLVASLTAVLTGCSSGELTTSNSPSSPTATASPEASPTEAKSPESKQPEGPKSDLTKKLESAASDLVAKEIGAEVKSFSCPNVEKLEAGKTFDCDTEIAAGSFPVTVTLSDDQGAFNVQTKNLLILKKAENLLKDGIKQRNDLDVTADCGQDFYIFKQVGDTYECKLSSTDGKSGVAVLKVTDVEGGVDISYSLK
ncbi:MAG: DUF4333 domain-containing protein [Cyanobacteria bacterium]|nr:DUF4333 domain-containing protein [Cyanobacteriota bacterium]MDW8199922.1 DUF4333 domain-containing protein [Cyanobacteriota bacterium SKYGB_h_bin112]